MPGNENPNISFRYVYVLQSLRGEHLYIGFTKDLKRRLQEHNDGLNFSTKPYAPWMVIHYEAYGDEKDAHRREKYLKTSQGSRLLKRMLKEFFYAQKNTKLVASTEEHAR